MAAAFGTTFLAATIGATTIASAHSRRKGRGWAWGRGGRDKSNKPCFLSGTKIRTESGEIAIEDLRAGDVVLTASGNPQAIRQIDSWEAVRDPGRDWLRHVAPIKVCRSALAPNVPCRDLYLSPGHSLYLDGVLMRVGALENGCSIVRCARYDADRLNYFHLRLDDHQIIFAEGAPVKSLLDGRMVPYAPICYGGPRYELARRLRKVVPTWVHKRPVFDKIHDHLDARAKSGLAA